MVRRDGAETRRERINQIARKVQAALYNKGETCLSKIVAAVEIETGLSEPKVLEILQLLEKAGQFSLDTQNDKIKKVTCV